MEFFPSSDAAPPSSLLTPTMPDGWDVNNPMACLDPSQMAALFQMAQATPSPDLMADSATGMMPMVTPGTDAVSGASLTDLCAEAALLDDLLGCTSTSKPIANVNANANAKDATVTQMPTPLATPAPMAPTTPAGNFDELVAGLTPFLDSGAELANGNSTSNVPFGMTMGMSMGMGMPVATPGLSPSLLSSPFTGMDLNNMNLGMNLGLNLGMAMGLPTSGSGMPAAAAAFAPNDLDLKLDPGWDLDMAMTTALSPSVPAAVGASDMAFGSDDTMLRPSTGPPPPQGAETKPMILLRAHIMDELLPMPRSASAPPNPPQNVFASPPSASPPSMPTSPTRPMMSSAMSPPPPNLSHPALKGTAPGRGGRKPKLSRLVTQIPSLKSLSGISKPPVSSAAVASGLSSSLLRGFSEIGIITPKNDAEAARIAASAPIEPMPNLSVYANAAAAAAAGATGMSPATHGDMKHASTLATTSHEVIQSELTAKDASAAAAAAAAPVTTVTTASGAKKHAFHCERCPATFGRRHDLMRHTRIHLGIRPYVCGKCGKHFSRQDALRRHTLEDGEDGTPNPLADGSGDCKTLMARREREARQGGLAAAVVNLAAAQAAAGMMQAQGLMMPSASSSINASLAMPGMGGMLFH